MLASVAVAAVPGLGALAQEGRYLIYPEQRRIEVRAPEQIRPTPLPPTPAPPTVDTAEALQHWPLTLDDAIRIALENAVVVRVLAGQATIAAGPTIYDPAITNNQIDQERARFDPALFSNNAFVRSERPEGFFSAAPPGATIDAATIDAFQTENGILKDFVTGGNLRATVGATNSDARTLLPLNPQTSTNTELRATQPLLQGAGSEVSLAPIIIARINTERSYFQLKDSVQDLVQSTIDGYWQLVFAEVNAWARQQQVQQGLETLERAEAQLRAGRGHESDVAQARVAYENFRANLIGAEANLLNQEAALRNVLGIPPADGRRLRPVTPMNTARYQADWQYLRTLAEQYRPDLIQQRLQLESDDQELILARNRTLPQLDAVAAYRWNDLEGRAPAGTWIGSGPGQFTEWEYGINLSLPLGQRAARARLRQRELARLRDRANLEQGLHSANHDLATSVRSVSQYYRQYEIYRRTREAALVNLKRQMTDYALGRPTIYLNVLQAITDWGNAVANESQAIALYNTELANLERETGTILETHGVRFVDELYDSMGPLGRLQQPVCYPRAMSPGPNTQQPWPDEQHRYLPNQIMRLPPVDAPEPEVLPRPR